MASLNSGFAGVQGSGGTPSPQNYTWGGKTPRQLAYSAPGVDALPQGAANYDDATKQGWYKARDASDGQWIWTQAGMMTPMDTSGQAMTSTGYGREIPTASANLPGSALSMQKTYMPVDDRKTAQNANPVLTTMPNPVTIANPSPDAPVPDTLAPGKLTNGWGIRKGEWVAPAAYSQQTPNSDGKQSQPGAPMPLTSGLASTPAQLPSSAQAPLSLAEQLRAQYSTGLGGSGSWDDAGYDRAAELAQMLEKAGVTSLDGLAVKTVNRPYTADELASGQTRPDQEAGGAAWEAYNNFNPNAGVTTRQLQIGDKTLGYLGDYNNDGTFGSNASDMLKGQGQDNGHEDLLAWSARGDGNTSYRVYTDPQTGKTYIAPGWNSSSDAANARKMAIATAAMVAGGYALAGPGAAGAGAGAGAGAAEGISAGAYGSGLTADTAAGLVGGATSLEAGSLGAGLTAPGAAASYAGAGLVGALPSVPQAQAPTIPSVPSGPGGPAAGGVLDKIGGFAAKNPKLVAGLVSGGAAALNGSGGDVPTAPGGSGSTNTTAAFNDALQQIVGGSGGTAGTTPGTTASNLALSAGDPNQFYQAASDAAYAQQTRYLDPQVKQQQQALEARLAEQGFVPGTPGYDQAMQNFMDTNARAYAAARDASILQGFQVGNQNFGNSLSNAQLNNSTIAQSLNQTLAQRSQALNEVNAATTRDQIQYGNALDQYNAKQQTSNSNNQLLGQLAQALAIYYSDARLKDDIIPIGQTPGGLGIYSYTIFGRRETGVIAQEVRAKQPYACVEDPASGFLMVDYGRIS